MWLYPHFIINTASLLFAIAFNGNDPDIYRCGNNRTSLFRT